MNKSNIFPFFLQTIILINNIIFPYLFYYKKLNIFLKLYFLTTENLFNLFTKNGMLHAPKKSLTKQQKSTKRDPSYWEYVDGLHSVQNSNS